MDKTNGIESEREQVTIEAGGQIGRVWMDVGGLFVVSREPRESTGRLPVPEMDADQSATAALGGKSGAFCAVRESVESPFRRNRLHPEQEQYRRMAD